jgi:hypothetical protein
MIFDGNDIFIAAITTGLMLMVLLMTAIFRSQANTLSAWQFISSRNHEGRDVADIDKLGKVVVLFVFTGIVIMQAHKGTLNDTTLLLYISYAGGIAGWSAYLRTKTGATK